MSLFKIAWRSLEQRALSSVMTGLSMALGVALVVAVLVFQGVIAKSFSKAAEGYNIIIGAKGGRMDLVMNTVFHLGQPIENIPWDFYKEFTQQGVTGSGKPGKFAGVVDVAVPYCLGDNYKGFRVIGTTPELFSRLGYGIDPDGRPMPYRYVAGQCYADDDYFGAVIGYMVASQTGLRVGDEFEPTHGVSTEEGMGHKHDPFIVRGILAPNGTPNDRALFVNMEGFFLLKGHAKEQDAPPAATGGHPSTEPKTLPAATESSSAPAPAPAPKAEPSSPQDQSDATDACQTPPETAPKAADSPGHAHDHGHDHGHDHAHGHDHEHHQPLPEDQREVTAILIRTSLDNPMAGSDLPRIINKGAIAQAVLPIAEIRKLFDGVIGNLQKILLVLAVLIVVVAGIGIMVSIYNSMSDRRREIAIMRALGASRGTVRTLILLESILLSVVGGLTGFLLGHGLIGLLSPYIAYHTGVPIGAFQFVQYELFLIPGLMVLASLAGYVPALSAYRTDVAKALTQNG